MADTRLEQLANVLVSHSAGVEPGDVVYIESTPVAAPLVRELHRCILSAGGHPQSHVVLPGAQEALVTHGSDDLRKRGADAGAEVDMTVEGRNRAV